MDPVCRNGHAWAAGQTMCAECGAPPEIRWGSQTLTPTRPATRTVAGVERQRAAARTAPQRTASTPLEWVWIGAGLVVLSSLIGVAALEIDTTGARMVAVTGLGVIWMGGWFAFLVGTIAKGIELSRRTQA